MKLSVMSTRYCVPVDRLRRLQVHGLSFEDDNLHIDALHKRALSDASRKRVSSYSVAYIAQAWTNQTSEWEAREQSLRESYADGGEALDAAFDAALGDYIGQEKLADAEDILKRIADAPGNAPDHDAMLALATWAKHLLDVYDRATDHNFLAARLLVSVPLLDMPRYPKIIATAIARVRWHKHLAGYWRLEKDESGKKVIWQSPKKLFDL